MIKGVKSIKWPIWVVIFLMFFILTFTIGKSIQAIQNITYKEAISVKINSEQIETGIKLQTETKEADSFTSFVTYPYTRIEEIDLPIREWVLEQEKMFYDEMEQTETTLEENIEAHLNVQTEIFKVNDDIFSIVMTAEQLVDNVNEFTLLKTFTIDLDKNKIVELVDIFTKEMKGNEFYLLTKDNIKDEKITNEIDEDKFKEHLQSLHNLEWAIHKNNINFYFNPSEIGTHNSIVEVEVPITQIYKYINDNYESILITEEIEEEIEQIEREQALEPRDLQTNGKYIALTFDDGPHEEVTPRILETLKEYDAKATFYMLGKKAETYPEIAKQVADEGHEVANHSVTHANLNAVSGERIRTEVLDSLTQIEKATGVTPTTFRPPYGEFNQTVIDHAEDSNQSIIMWSVDTLDWKSRNADSIYEVTKNQSRSGSIVLMHDIHPTTADALPQVLKYLSDEGFEFVTVQELLPLIEGEDVGPYYGN